MVFNQSLSVCCALNSYRLLYLRMSIWSIRSVLVAEIRRSAGRRSTCIRRASSSQSPAAANGHSERTSDQVEEEPINAADDSFSNNAECSTKFISESSSSAAEPDDGKKKLFLYGECVIKRLFQHSIKIFRAHVSAFCALFP